MKNTLKTIIALVLVGVMMFTTMSALAADPTNADMNGEKGVIGEFTNDNPTVYTDTVTLYKEITVFNPEECKVNAPTITYTYNIVAGAAGKDIYDVKSAHNPEANVHVTTKAGVGTPAVTASLDGTSFPNNTLAFTPSVQFDASATGVANKYKLKVDFSSIDFKTDGTGAGVYRYVITETPADADAEAANSTKKAAGIKDGEISDTRYLDVYVDGKGDIYGYVCFQNNNSIDARDNATTNTVTEAAKTEGFVATTTGGTNGTTAQTADQYYTFNFEVKKVVENDAYTMDNHHKFPFTITLANANVTAHVLPIMTFSDNGTTFAATADYVEQTALEAKAISQTWTPKIAHNAAVSYVGIPCGTTVTIKEKNDVTGVTYASVSENADTNATVKNIDTDAESNEAIINCTTHLEAAGENHTAAKSKQIIFTNTLLQISPTGVTLRFAPYILILAAGIVLLLVSRRRKSNIEK